MQGKVPFLAVFLALSLVACGGGGGGGGSALPPAQDRQQTEQDRQQAEQARQRRAEEQARQREEQARQEQERQQAEQARRDAADYDANGWNRNGIHRDTGAAYDPQGFDRAGFDRAGYNQAGFDRDGYSRQGYNAAGYDRDGYNAQGRDSGGYNRDGYNAAGFDRDGYNAGGWSQNNLHRATGTLYNPQGYDRSGNRRQVAPQPQPVAPAPVVQVVCWDDSRADTEAQCPPQPPSASCDPNYLQIYDECPIIGIPGVAALHKALWDLPERPESARGRVVVVDSHTGILAANSEVEGHGTRVLRVARMFAGEVARGRYRRRQEVGESHSGSGGLVDYVEVSVRYPDILGTYDCDADKIYSFSIGPVFNPLDPGGLAHCSSVIVEYGLNAPLNEHSHGKLHLSQDVAIAGETGRFIAVIGHAGRDPETGEWLRGNSAPCGDAMEFCVAAPPWYYGYDPEDCAEATGLARDICAPGWAEEGLGWDLWTTIHGGPVLGRDYVPGKAAHIDFNFRRRGAGNSFATPKVAAVMGVVGALWPEVTAVQLVELVLDFCTHDIGAPGTDPIFGRGAVDFTCMFEPAGDLLDPDTLLSVASGTLSLPGGASVEVQGEDHFGRGFSRAMSVLSLSPEAPLLPLTSMLEAPSLSGLEAAAGKLRLTAPDPQKGEVDRTGAWFFLTADHMPGVAFRGEDGVLALGYSHERQGFLGGYGTGSYRLGDTHRVHLGAALSPIPLAEETHLTLGGEVVYAQMSPAARSLVSGLSGTRAVARAEVHHGFRGGASISVHAAASALQGRGQVQEQGFSFATDPADDWSAGLKARWPF